MHGIIEQDSIQDFRRATKNKLRDVCCPDHRQRPRVRVTGTCLRDAAVSLTGCCGKLMEMANQAIASR